MTAALEFQCWRCGVVIVEEVALLRREEMCTACNADLKVCKSCTFYNPSVSDACDEPIAAEVTNKERANFCDYYKMSRSAFRRSASGTDSVERAQLDALFGDAQSEPASSTGDADQSEIERLFGLDKDA
jgi:hypothetical protein